MYDLMTGVVLIIGIIGIVLIIRISNKKIEENKQKIIDKYGVPTKIINEHGLFNNKIAYIFESHKLLIIDEAVYRFDDITGYSLNGKSYKVSTSTGAMIGRGVIGGLLFGGVGALSGATTATKDVKPNGENVIYITLNNLATPMVEYRLLDDSMAQEFIAILKIIVDRNSQKG